MESMLDQQFFFFDSLSVAHCFSPPSNITRMAHKQAVVKKKPAVPACA